jgi:choline-sulfatase/uncharacterized sulfatase
MKDRPNVLLLLSDQHNAKFLAHAGHPDVKTPHLDRLAGQGVRFGNAIAQNPICTPSRICWLSGQYCHNHGYYSNSGPNPQGLPTILGHFRRSGYRTAAVGKIHCPEYWVEDDCDLFDDPIGASIGGNGPYLAYLRDKGLSRDDGTPRQFAHVDNAGLDGAPSTLDYGDLPEGYISHRTGQFIRQAVGEGRPFFAVASFPRPHGPIRPARRFWDLYPFENIHLPPNADWDLAGKSPALRNMLDYWKAGSWIVYEPAAYEAARMRTLRGYLALVTQVDHAVGELLGWLDELGISDNTIVIYSTDHGAYSGEHGIIEKAPGICSDAVTRIPMIWRWPGRFACGHQAGEIVETVDFATTISRLCGLDDFQTGDGLDISHLLAGQGGAVRELGVTEFPWSRSIRKGRYRYVHYQPEVFAAEYPEGFGELYDLQADPWEMRNLYFDASQQATVAQLRLDLLNWLLATTRPRTVHPFVRFDSRQGFSRYHNTVNADGKIHPNHIRQRIAEGGWKRNYL